MAIGSYYVGIPVRLQRASFLAHRDIAACSLRYKRALTSVAGFFGENSDAPAYANSPASKPMSKLDTHRRGSYDFNLRDVHREKPSISHGGFLSSPQQRASLPYLLKAGTCCANALMTPYCLGATFSSSKSHNLLAKRFYGESVDISRSILSLRDGNSALEFFDSLHVCDTANLQRLLRAVVVLPASSSDTPHVVEDGKPGGRDTADASPVRNISRATLFEDPRFLRLIEAISERIASMESRWIAQIGMTLALVRKRLPCLNALAEKIGEVVLTRENALAPRQISMLTFSLSSLGIHSPELVEFLRLEAVKTLHDFAPQDLHTLLEGMRNWGMNNRELTDLVLEKMTDEIDRFTASDIGFSLRTLSALGLARGFLLRRMASLAFENLQQFNARQIVMVFHSLAKLRFLSQRHCSELLSSLSHSLDMLNENYSSQLMMAMCLSNFTEGDEIVRQLLEKFSANETQRFNAVILSNVAYAICYFQLFEYNELLKGVVTKVMETSPSRNTRNLTLMAEVMNSLEVENKTCELEISQEWKQAIKEHLRQDQEKADSSRLHNEIFNLLTQLQGPYKLNFQKHQHAGLYPVFLLDDEAKICFDSDNLKRHTNLEMKHRHLSLLGYHPIVVHFWDWRRCRTEDDQIFYLKKLLTKKLRDCGKIE